MKSTTTQFNAGRTALWASAFVIAALIVLQAGKLQTNTAYAETVATGAGYTVMTVDSGRGEDADPDEVLVVIDNRTEMIMVYEADARNGAIIPRDGGPLPVLFRRALNR